MDSIACTCPAEAAKLWITSFRCCVFPAHAVKVAVHNFSPNSQGPKQHSRRALPIDSAELLLPTITEDRTEPTSDSKKNANIDRRMNRRSKNRSFFLNHKLIENKNSLGANDHELIVCMKYKDRTTKRFPLYAIKLFYVYN
jgi:hypothetical protein